MYENKFILFLLCACSTLSLVKSNSIIETSTGPVKGQLKCYENTNYNSYEGIPYAEPPLGDLRFRPPVPIKKWKNVLNADCPGAVCPQPEVLHLRSEMSENCLFLNIYVPVTVTAKPLPVVFVIHGGYYIFGSGNPRPIYGPEKILGRGIIVVSINYRLGALGFLSFDSIDASGNAGLKDVLLALKWTNSNIKKFGGDPKKICLYGVGTGAALAHYLLLIKQSSGLFQSAIITSGSATNYRSVQTHPKENALKLAKQLGIKHIDKHCLQKLKEVDAFAIIEAEDCIMRNDPRRGFVLVDLFSPTIEKPSSIALITKHPLEIIRTEGLVQKVPIITGFNNHDGLEIFTVLKETPNAVDVLNENFELCIPPDIKYPINSKERKDLAESIREVYFCGKNISIFTTQNYINLITDTAYAYSVDNWIKIIKSQECSSQIYYYKFKFDGQLNAGKLLWDITYPGAGYGDDVGYFFVTNETENKLQNLNYKSQYIFESLLNSASNLILHGNPTPPRQGCCGVQCFEWVETGCNRNHVVIGDLGANVFQPPLKDRLKFWYEQYAKYYEYEKKHKKC